MPQRRRRPSPSTVIACLALFFAIAGGSAIALQGRNTVDSGDIKRGAVKTSDIANNAVTTKKIRNNHVRAADIQNNAVGTGEIRNGQVAAADLAPDEAVHRVGDPGEPPFGNGGQVDCIWSKFLPPPGFGDPYVDPFFYKDSGGRVHLEGTYRSQNGPGGDLSCGPDANDEDQVLFVLPPGYRPGGALTTFPVYDATSSSYMPLSIIGDPGLSFPGGSYAPGSVILSEPNAPTIALIGDISFRAAGGASGLPRRGGGPIEVPSGGLPPLE